MNKTKGIAVGINAFTAQATAGLQQENRSGLAVQNPPSPIPRDIRYTTEILV